MCLLEMDWDQSALQKIYEKYLYVLEISQCCI